MYGEWSHRVSLTCRRQNGWSEPKDRSSSQRHSGTKQQTQSQNHSCQKDEHKGAKRYVSDFFDFQYVSRKVSLKCGMQKSSVDKVYNIIIRVRLHKDGYQQFL